MSHRKQKKHKKHAARRPKRQPDQGQTTPTSQPPAAQPPGRVLSLDPLAPLIVRSGRPFDGQAGVDPARFPPPSTTAGCLRTAWARQTDQAFGPELARLAVHGPLLARADSDGDLHLLAPKPADALYFGHGPQARCVRAEPQPWVADCGADLPAGLTPLQLSTPQSGKPGDGPQWWDWRDLIAFRQGEDIAHSRLASNGWSPPAGDRRTHIAIDPATGASSAGQLFQTEGLDLSPQDGLTDPSQTGLRLLLRSAEPLAPALVHLGGKRRLAAMEAHRDDAWPQPPESWWQRIRAAGGLTLTLLTPALFDAGYRPGWLDDQLRGSPPTTPGLRLQLAAAATERWQPHSGWDLARRRPRATRKLVAAGATYWLRILGDSTEQDLAASWLASLCDQPQDRDDGFGIALPAPWTPTADPDTPD